MPLSISDSRGNIINICLYYFSVFFNFIEENITLCVSLYTLDANFGYQRWLLSFTQLGSWLFPFLFYMIVLV